ncbi:uncharacterized protein LOC143904455 [Temnothorax americanus]|uniref:uncharacterized protein LOC143904455 n=1 Tax=Temnothorax americanus TaxID=1964332 RepID=UPI004068CF1B
MSAPTFVDLQGFVVGMKFVVKEAAVLKNGAVLAHYIFTCPMPWNLLTKSDKSCASWLIRNHHGLRWEDGNVPYSKVKRLITSAVLGEEKDDNDDDDDDDDDDDKMPTLVYVKGCQKREWLVDLLENKARNLNIETLDADYEDIESLNILDATNTMRCGKHVKNCALQNVLKIFNWWSKRQRELSSF